MDVDAGACTEREITAPVALCSPDGRLDADAIGWTRRPLHDCALPGTWGRRKRWDFWGITGPSIAMNLVVADADYVGIAGIWFRDLEAGLALDKGYATALAREMALPDRVGGAAISVRSRSLDLSFAEESGGTRLRARADGFEADVFAHRPDGHESLGVVIPWSARRFQYTNKDPARPVEGTVSWGGRVHALAPDGTSWACLDYGRGKWPYRTKWNWGAGAGMCGGRRVGLQLGGKWTDGTGMTENAVGVDGRLSKISEELVWVYDTNDWLRPWTIHTPVSDRVRLTFSPVYDKRTRLRLGVASQSVDQCFGTYSGTVVADGGERLHLDAVAGWAEEATWRW